MTLSSSSFAQKYNRPFGQRTTVLTGEGHKYLRAKDTSTYGSIPATTKPQRSIWSPADDTDNTDFVPLGHPSEWCLTKWDLSAPSVGKHSFRYQKWQVGYYKLSLFFNLSLNLSLIIGMIIYQLSQKVTEWQLFSEFFSWKRKSGYHSFTSTVPSKEE